MSSTASPTSRATASAPVNPLLVPPAGGWIDPSKAPMSQQAILLVGPITTFYILALVAIGMRIYARRIKKISFRLSDYAVFIAALFGTAYVAMCWLGEN
jgi:hypothetical protein